MIKALGNSVVLLEFQVLGILHKLITGPWMSRFYAPFSDQTSIVSGLLTVQSVIGRLEEKIENPNSVLHCTHDLLGNELIYDDELRALMQPPQDHDLFISTLVVPDYWGCKSQVFDLLLCILLQEEYLG